MTTGSLGQLWTNRTWSQVAAQLKDECEKWSERIESFTTTSYRDAQRDGSVTVNIMTDGEWKTISCDRFKYEPNGPQRNLLALVQIIQARRKESQRGIEDAGSQAQKAFALPDPDDPYHILGIERGASIQEIIGAWRKQAKKTHPEAVGGSRETFERAREAARRLGVTD